MGIYLRYAAALIIIFTASDSYSAVRKSVSTPSKQSVVESSGASFQTPNGEAAFYGRDFVDDHTAGNRFKPGDSPIAPRQKITLKPSLTANPSAVARAAIKALRGGPGAVVAGVATAAIVDAVGGFIDENGQPVKEKLTDVPASGLFWCYQPTATCSTNPAAGHANIAVDQPIQIAQAFSAERTTASMLYKAERVKSSTANIAVLEYSYTRLSNGNKLFGELTVYRRGSCPSGSVYSPTSYMCQKSVLVPLDDSDLSLADSYVKTRDSAFVRDLLKDACSGSLNPSACFDELTSWGKLSGPSSQSGPSSTTTTVTTNPDGTISTTSTTSHNKYNYTYGDNYYDYTTTTVSSTTKDGLTTTTETTDSSPSDPVQDEKPDEPEESYSFQDSQLPDVPTFYEQKYPDGLSGVWDDASAQVNNSQFIQFLNGFVPSFSGSCPSFGLSFNIASWASYGSIGFTSLCYVFDFIKVILLVTALFTFRAITFGG